jgi:5-methylcytosine-specific restriction endonuclease McrA
MRKIDQPIQPIHIPNENYNKVNMGTAKKITLQKFKPKYVKKSIPKSVKKMVWDKYIGAEKGKAKCYCCKHQTIRQIEFHCGHVIAEANGGHTTVVNMRPICAQCNLSMGKMNMNDFMKNFMKN